MTKTRNRVRGLVSVNGGGNDGGDLKMRKVAPVCVHVFCGYVRGHTSCAGDVTKRKRGRTKPFMPVSADSLSVINNGNVSVV